MAAELKTIAFKVPVTFAEKLDNFAQATGLRKNVMFMAALDQLIEAPLEEREEIIRRFTERRELATAEA